MKRKIIAGLLALACACMVGLPALASAAAVSAAKASETESNATAYQYWLFDPEKKSLYLNEVYCAIDKVSVMGENGRYYYLTDVSALADTSDFGCTLKSTSNAQYIKSLRVAQEEMQMPDKPSYAVRMTENAVLDPLTLGFSATYTAKDTVVLEAREAGKKDKSSLSVAKGSKLVVLVNLRVEYDKLLRMDATPRYADSLQNTRKVSWPMGVSGDIMTPETSGDSDYTWESIGQLCAEMNTGGTAIAGAPKLSTLWSDGTLRSKFVKGDAFYRGFAANTLQGSVELTLTNPFQTIDGEESIAHKKVLIYEYRDDGKLYDVTSKFKYTTDSNGNGAFRRTVSSLGTYIISDVKPAA